MTRDPVSLTDAARLALLRLRRRSLGGFEICGEGDPVWLLGAALAAKQDQALEAGEWEEL